MILFVENWVVVDSFVEMALDGLRLVEEECGVWSPGLVGENRCSLGSL